MTPAEIAAAVIEAHPKAAADYRAGKTAALGFLLGQAMRLRERGPASASGIAEALRAALDPDTPPSR